MHGTSDVCTLSLSSVNMTLNSVVNVPVTGGGLGGECFFKCSSQRSITLRVMAVFSLWRWYVYRFFFGGDILYMF